MKKNRNSKVTLPGRRSDLAIMGKLIVLVKPLSGIMLTGIVLGVLGFLCAIFLTVLGGYGVLKGIFELFGKESLESLSLSGNAFCSLEIGWPTLFRLLLLFAIARGILHYGEQYCNHYIAFRILALIRHRVFAALRKLCPAKLEGKEKGNLISVITGDIELLEVFFAHTVSPIAIAFLTSLIMLFFIGKQHPLATLLAFFAYFTVAVLLPIWNGRRSATAGMALRSEMGDLNNFVLDSLYGLDEILQYAQGEKQLAEMDRRSKVLAEYQRKLSSFEGSQRAVTNLFIQIFSWSMFFLMLFLYQKGSVSFSAVILATLAMMSSFGPVVALSSLSNTLNQTLACGERVLSLLEEKPAVEELTQGAEVDFAGASVENVAFSYQEEQILRDVSLEIPKGKVLGIHGVSGSGKSTLLKLLMRFWDVRQGKILLSGTDIREINTSCLRKVTGYVTQDTILFHDTIRKNIALAKDNADQAEIEEAAKKAGIHNFIVSLPKGYESNVGELGDTLSDGEKQRIGLARAFLHDADLLLLDEPTSNLDVLNEGIILQSLAKELKEKKGKTVVLVSHRQSTMSLAEDIYEMEKGRFC